jgi:hypothetical protein
VSNLGDHLFGKDWFQPSFLAEYYICKSFIKFGRRSSSAGQTENSSVGRESAALLTSPQQHSRGLIAVDHVQNDGPCRTRRPLRGPRLDRYAYQFSGTCYEWLAAEFGGRFDIQNGIEAVSLSASFHLVSAIRGFPAAPAKILSVILAEMHVGC